jgi:hypothetical protein
MSNRAGDQIDASPDTVLSGDDGRREVVTRAQAARDAGLRRLARANAALLVSAVLATGVITDVVSQRAAAHGATRTAKSIVVVQSATKRSTEKTRTSLKAAAAPTASTGSSSSGSGSTGSSSSGSGSTGSSSSGSGSTSSSSSGSGSTSSYSSGSASTAGSSSGSGATSSSVSSGAS